MLRHQGGEQVKAGFYFNAQSWEITTLSGQGGVLAGTTDTRFLRLPLPVLLVAAPLMGAAFAMFLPFIGFAMVADYAVRQAWGAGREALQGATVALSPRTRAGEAYFTGSDAEQATGEQTPEAEAKLKELEKAVEAKEREQ